MGPCAVLTAGLSQAARAADLTGPHSGDMVPQQLSMAYGYGGFNPLLDPRCRIIPVPEAGLYGDTARFRPAPICQCRGLYVDSVVVP